MGQYFLAVCPDRGEYVKPSSFGCGLKAGEILGSSVAQMDAHAILIADPGIKPRPADLAVRGVTGLWAGLPSFYIGDECGMGDAPKWPWGIPECDIYGEIQNEGRDLGGRLVGPVSRTHGFFPGEMRSTIQYLDGTRETHRRTETIALRPDGEGVAIDMDAYGNSTHYNDMLSRARPKIAKEKLSSYMLDARDGGRRLVANLDRREYIDPRQLAEIPTLAGIMRGQAKIWRADPPMPDGEAEPPSTLQLLSRKLFSEGSDEGCDGEWRTDRLLITAERSRRFPTTAQIEADPDWTDVTQRLVAATVITVRPWTPDGAPIMPKTPDWARFHRDIDNVRHTWRAA